MNTPSPTNTLSEPSSAPREMGPIQKALAASRLLPPKDHILTQEGESLDLSLLPGYGEP